LKAHHAFADKYSWYEIAHDPWEARRIIRRGHLAVILSVECSHLMPKSHGEWRDQLDELYDLGARAMQLSHETDTRFAGAAFQHGKLFKWKHLFTKVSWAQMDPDMREQLKATRIRVDALQRAEKYRRLSTNDPRARNPLGITPEGFQLVEEMAKKNMILEIDHCSRLGRKQLYDRVRSSKAPKHLRWYPLNYSHSRIDELMPSRAWMEKEFGKAAVKDNVDKTKESTGWDGNYTTMEYMSTVKESKYVIPTGGIFGIRTGPNAQVKSRGSGVENRCHTSSRSLAQIVAELDKAGIAVSLGTDFAGFTAMTAARFERRKKDWTRKEEYAATGMPNQKPDKYGGDAPPVKRGNRLSEFNFLGLAHIGLTPDLLQDFENLGLDVRGLRGSAEATLRMWERCHDPKRQEMTPAQYRKRMITEVAAGVK
jgi:microsomal dipeptidase-like Zn-dependent dipeptidase